MKNRESRRLEGEAKAEVNAANVWLAHASSGLEEHVKTFGDEVHAVEQILETTFGANIGKSNVDFQSCLEAVGMMTRKIDLPAIFREPRAEDFGFIDLIDVPLNDHEKVAFGYHLHHARTSGHPLAVATFAIGQTCKLVLSGVISAYVAAGERNESAANALTALRVRIADEKKNMERRTMNIQTAVGMYRRMFKVQKAIFDDIVALGKTWYQLSEVERHEVVSNYPPPCQGAQTLNPYRYGTG